MATSPTSVSEAQAPINHLGRIVGALVNPKSTLEDIARRPSWVIPMALLTIFSLGVCFFMNQKIDWPGYIRAKAEKNPRFEQLSDEQKQQQLQMSTKFAGGAVTYVFGLVIPITLALIVALVYWGAFNLFAGAGATFGQSFGITAHAFLPFLIADVLTMITLAAKPFGEATPETMLASHPGALLSPDAPRWQLALLSSFELFWIWILILLAVGFTAVNRKKLSVSKSLGIVLGVWLVWVAVKTGFAAIFS
jgi:hypothetical protein